MSHVSTEKFVPINLSDDESDSREDEDVEMREVVDATDETNKLQGATTISSDRLIVAIDFGTTFSSVAYAKVKAHESSTALRLRDIKCISNYPDDPLDTVSSGAGPREDVPTELWYNVQPPRRRGRFPRPPVSPEPDETGPDTISTSSDSDSDNEVDSSVIPTTENGQSQHDHVYWGFSVREHLQRVDIPDYGTRRIARFKLYLNKVDATKDVYEDVGQTLRKLRTQKMITQDADVFVDYLKRLLQHTKMELIRLGEYTEDISIEFVLCVPAVWPSKACRTMQAALTAAAKESAFGRMIDGSLDNLFIMSEPEAAATCVLAEGRNDTRVNEIIVVVDAGGGTVDVATYNVENKYPLYLTRLRDEVTKPATALSGGTFVNEQFGERLRNELMNETYLFENEQSLDSIVEAKVFEFEKYEKRRANVLSPFYNPPPIDIPYLRANVQKGFTHNRIQISRKWMKKVFKPSLEASATLLREQLEKAKDEGCSVSKVILVGGYGGSPSLRARLQQLVDEERNLLGHPIYLLTPDAPATMVVKGAVLRALNKDNGPRRNTSCSYGFLIDELYQPHSIEAHHNVKPRKNETDGKRYINNSIYWLIQKDEHLPRNYSRKITVTQKLPARSTYLKCTQDLYISDTEQKSHYRRGHVNNKDAEYAGQITADMTFLRDDGHIELQRTTEADGKTRTYWAFEYDVVMIIDGRNLRYEARWPPLGDHDIEGSNNSYASGQISIAAGFQPGTA